jgi:hypothetical protein
VGQEIMLHVLLVLLNFTLAAPLCTVKVDTETLKSKQVIQTYKFKNMNVRQCKQRANKISGSPAKANERFKFVSWEWRNKKTVAKK